MPARACTEEGCTETVSRRGARCPAHARQRKTALQRQMRRQRTPNPTDLQVRRYIGVALDRLDRLEAVFADETAASMTVQPGRMVRDLAAIRAPLTAARTAIGQPPSTTDA